MTVPLTGEPERGTGDLSGESAGRNGVRGPWENSGLSVGMTFRFCSEDEERRAQGSSVGNPPTEGSRRTREHENGTFGGARRIAGTAGIEYDDVHLAVGADGTVHLVLLSADDRTLSYLGLTEARGVPRRQTSRRECREGGGEHAP